MFGDIAGELLRPEINQHDMGVGAAGNDIEAMPNQRFREYGGIFHDLRGISFERRGQRLAKGDVLARNHMHQRTALNTRENRRVYFLGDGLVVGQDHAAAGSTQCLVGRRRHDMRMGERAWVNTSSNETGEMRHVHHQERPDFIGNLAEGSKIDMTWIGRATGDDHFRLMFPGEGADLIEINLVCVFRDAVMHGVEPFAGLVRRGAMGQMSPGGERQAEDGIARLDQRHEGADIFRGDQLDLVPLTSEFQPDGTKDIGIIPFKVGLEEAGQLGTLYRHL